MADKRRLARIGEAAISATMTDAEAARDPARAFRIAQAAIRAARTASRADKPPI